MGGIDRFPKQVFGIKAEIGQGAAGAGIEAVVALGIGQREG